MDDGETTRRPRERATRGHDVCPPIRRDDSNIVKPWTVPEENREIDRRHTGWRAVLFLARGTRRRAWTTRVRRVGRVTTLSFVTRSLVPSCDRTASPLSPLAPPISSPSTAPPSTPTSPPLSQTPFASTDLATTSIASAPSSPCEASASSRNQAPVARDAEPPSKDHHRTAAIRRTREIYPIRATSRFGSDPGRRRSRPRRVLRLGSVLRPGIASPRRVIRRVTSP